MRLILPLTLHPATIKRMNYWAMKSEPDVYGIDDLMRESPAIWEGCRNYQVRLWMREMKVGDLAIMSHSNSKPSGPAGVMRIVREAYTDPTQFDPKSEYYDAKSTKENPKWIAPDVAFVAKFPHVLSLVDLKAVPELQSMMLLKKGNMFSVTPASKEEFETIVRLAGLDPVKF